MSYPLIRSVCFSCRRLRGDYSCAAFPCGIPKDAACSSLLGGRDAHYEARTAADPKLVFVSQDPMELPEEEGDAACAKT
jgi:hypothetical protein